MSAETTLVEESGVSDIRRNDALEEIPILDLGPYLAGEAGAAEKLVAELRYAQENIGFYFIINHGVTPSLFDRCFDELKQFFALPFEEKIKLKFDTDMIGYIPPKSTIYETSTINENTKKDQNETILIGVEFDADHPRYQEGRRFRVPNKWPQSLPSLRETMVEYQQTMMALGWQLLPLYAQALDKPADYFNPYFENEPHCIGRNSHYPVVDLEENQFGIAPHSDHGFITLLPLSEVPGLEVLTQSGKWIPAPHIPGAILVNTGEFLNRWTNGRFIATPHRVVSPAADRYAITFFYSPCDEAVAEPLDTCVGPGNPAQYEPMSFIEYLAFYTDGNFLHEKRKRGAAGDAALAK
ncbi:MAG: isopenicillin N synthase family oxygenase [Alphaproteobacteria bacterium]|nr:isopenicillin N synthase family oxygenase [Alphaproteobacteria bacterium]